MQYIGLVEQIPLGRQLRQRELDTGATRSCSSYNESLFWGQIKIKRADFWDSGLLIIKLWWILTSFAENSIGAPFARCAGSWPVLQLSGGPSYRCMPSWADTGPVSETSSCRRQRTPRMWECPVDHLCLLPVMMTEWYVIGDMTIAWKAYYFHAHSSSAVWLSAQGFAETEILLIVSQLKLLQLNVVVLCVMLS